MPLTADRRPPTAGAFKGADDPRRQIGRKKGSRSSLATAFFNNLYCLWEEQGEAVLRRAAFEKPMEFAAMVAKLMPAKLEISTPTAGMTDEQLSNMIELADRMLALNAGQVVAPSMTIEGSALLIEGGGGSPHDDVTGGEVVEVVHCAPDTPTPLFAAAGLKGDPDFAADPQGAPIQRQANMPESEVGNPTSAPPLAEEDDVDPASLF